MSERGYQQWLVKRIDIIGGGSGAYATAAGRAAASTVVFADDLEDALLQGSAALDVTPDRLSVRKIYAGFGVGESG